MDVAFKKISFKSLENMLSIIATHYGQLKIIDEKN